MTLSDRLTRRLMTSMLAVALVVSPLATVLAKTHNSGSHTCCVKITRTARCPQPTTMSCCRVDDRDSERQPTPPQRAQTAPSPDVMASLPAGGSIVATAPLPQRPPVVTARRLVDPPPLYLLNATLLV
jgi:hypothetical protein